jgi:hypothetical protein
MSEEFALMVAAVGGSTERLALVGGLRFRLRIVNALCDVRRGHVKDLRALLATKTRDTGDGRVETVNVVRAAVGTVG